VKHEGTLTAEFPDTREKQREIVQLNTDRNKPRIKRPVPSFLMYSINECTHTMQVTQLLRLHVDTEPRAYMMCVTIDLERSYGDGHSGLQWRRTYTPTCHERHIDVWRAVIKDTMLSF